jgi:hypothetical protein
MSELLYATISKQREKLLKTGSWKVVFHTEFGYIVSSLNTKYFTVEELWPFRLPHSPVVVNADRIVCTEAYDRKRKTSLIP